jgi:uncharacterized protein (TIGR03382 family)
MTTKLSNDSTNEIGAIDGLAGTHRYSNVVWVRSGEELYALNTFTRGPWKVEGASVGVDMALGWCNPRNVSRGDCLFIADIGADTPVADRAIYKVPEPDPNSSAREPLTAERHPIVYELGEGEEAPDARSLAVHPLTGSLYIITHEADEARVFEAAAPNAPGDTLTFRLVGKVGLDRPTSADISPDRSTTVEITLEANFLLVRNATDAVEIKLNKSSSVGAALSEPGARLRLEPDADGDSIAYAQLDAYGDRSVSWYHLATPQNQDIAPFELYTASNSGAQPLWRYSYPCDRPPKPEPTSMNQPDLGDGGDEGCTSAGTAAPAALLWLLAPLWARIRRRKDTH